MRRTTAVPRLILSAALSVLATVPAAPDLTKAVGTTIEKTERESRATVDG